MAHKPIGRQAGRQGDALSAPLSVALAQLVVLELQQTEQLAALEQQLADTRAAIAAIEKLSRSPVAAPTEASVPRNVVPPVPPSAPVRRAARPTTPTPPLMKGHAGAAASAARGTAILRLIGAGTRTVADLRVALPVPRGASDHQHRQSIANALTRLRGDGYVVTRADGWALTAKGRTRAAKEAP